MYVCAFGSKITSRGIKRTALYARDHSVEEGLDHVQLWNSSFLLSQDLSEAIDSALNRKAPKFKS